MTIERGPPSVVPARAFRGEHTRGLALGEQLRRSGQSAQRHRAAARRHGEGEPRGARWSTGSGGGGCGHRTRIPHGANKGFRAVSVSPAMKEGHPVAEITLIKGEQFKTVSEKLD